VAARGVGEIARRVLAVRTFERDRGAHEFLRSVVQADWPAFCPHSMTDAIALGHARALVISAQNALLTSRSQQKSPRRGFFNVAIARPRLSGRWPRPSSW